MYLYPKLMNVPWGLGPFMLSRRWAWGVVQEGEGLGFGLGGGGGGPGGAEAWWCFKHPTEEQDEAV